MNLITKIFLITSLLYSFLISAQYSTPFKLQIDKKSNWNIKVDTISETEAKNLKPLIYQEKEIDSDSLINSMLIKFPTTIISKDSCLILNGEKSPIKLCITKQKTKKVGEAFELIIS